MIISEYVDVKISPSNYKWYSDLGYDVSKNKLISVKIKDLTHGSSCRIDVECDICSEIRNVQVNNYNNQIKKHNFYACQKCNQKKSILTSLKKYGCEYPFVQNQESIEKSKKTLTKVYGVDNISKHTSVKDERSLFMKRHTKTYNKIIKEKYGDNVSKLDWVKDKKKITTMENWGVENPTQNPDIFEKSQKSGKKIKLHKTGIYFRGSYEEHFLDYCFDNNVEVLKSLYYLKCMETFQCMGYFLKSSDEAISFGGAMTL